MIRIAYLLFHLKTAVEIGNSIRSQG